MLDKINNALWDSDDTDVLFRRAIYILGVIMVADFVIKSIGDILR